MFFNFITIRLKMSFLPKVISKISVEPTLFLYFMTSVFSNCLGTNLLLYKACDPTGAIAQQVGSKCNNEEAAQHVVAPINAWKSLIQQLVPIALAMMAGTWSDSHGRRRRPLIVLPIIGQILADAMSMYSAINWSVSPAITAVMQAIILSCTGGSPMLFNGINSYVADSTSEEWRTTKFGILGGVMSVAVIMGMLINGIVVVNVGFVIAYLVCIVLGIMALVMTFLLIDDVAVTAKDIEYEKQLSSVDDVTLYQDIIRTINPMEVLRNCYRVMTRRRPGHGTTILFLVVLACAPLTCVPLEGEISVMYLFLRYKFKWNEIDFSIFNAYQISILSLGTMVALGILSNKFRMDDALIGTIASVFDLLAAIAFFLVSQSWQLYLVPPLELFRGAALMLTCSIASKSVESTELGAMNSVKLLIESTMKSGFLPLYNIIYNRTFESIPSAFFLISIILTAPLVFIFWLIYYLNQELKSNSIENGESSNETSITKDCT